MPGPPTIPGARAATIKRSGVFVPPPGRRSELDRQAAVDAQLAPQRRRGLAAPAATEIVLAPQVAAALRDLRLLDLRTSRVRHSGSRRPPDADRHRRRVGRVDRRHCRGGQPRGRAGSLRRRPRRPPVGGSSRRGPAGRQRNLPTAQSAGPLSRWHRSPPARPSRSRRPTRTREAAPPDRRSSPRSTGRRLSWPPTAGSMLPRLAVGADCRPCAP